ncbi:hypothetical protein DFH29DRAFT_302572 [Suillus ampliporus]|nr:hypothetical protein DFH29DRAFT_302572 [Suillus ampliporus]
MIFRCCRLRSTSPSCHSQNSDQEYGPLESVGVTGSLPEGTDHPIGQISQDTGLWLCGASGFVGYELGAQPFLPHHSTYSEGQTLSDSSVRHDQEILLPNVQGSQDKVTCIWPGCSRVIKKDNRTRHVNETHLRKVKAVCVGCGKGFARSYMKKDHVCRVRR